MDHQLLKRIIFDQHQTIKNTAIFNRELFFEKDVNYVLAGIRRAGKSTLLYKRVKDLIDDGVKWNQIIYINFDDERLINFKVGDFDDIVEVAEELTSEKHYYYFEEIQNIIGWEKFALRLANQKQKVDIAGSNSMMLSNEIASKLGGRYVTKLIFPFSFKEYLLSKGGLPEGTSTKDISYSNKLLETYFTYGGFPESFDLVEKREHLSNIYKKTFFGDVVAHYGVRNENSLRLLVSKIAETVQNEVSFTRLQNIITGIGYKLSKDVIINYCSYLQNAFLIFKLQNYYYSFVDKESTPKYYFTDNGILSLFLFDKNSILLENIVAIHLYRQFRDDLYYLKGKKFDIDFFIASKAMAIQVAYSLNYDSLNREIQSIVNCSKDNKDIKDFILVSYEQEKDLLANGVKIKVVPLKKFLLNY